MCELTGTCHFFGPDFQVKTFRVKFCTGPRFWGQFERNSDIWGLFFREKKTRIMRYIFGLIKFCRPLL